MLARPTWIVIDDAARRQIRYLWDDTRAMYDLPADTTGILGASMQMRLRARLVLCMGLYEWIVWRYDGLHDRAEPRLVAEAAWCATVDPRYLRFYELSRNEWLGPVDAPLWCAMTWLQPALSTGHQFPRAVYDALVFLARLALHVMPNRRPFTNWLDATMDRFVRRYPEMPEDPFTDPFDRDPAARLGPLIGRDALDPTVEPDEAAGRAFLAAQIAEAVRTGNPFLATPDDLADLGFLGAPYRLPPLV